MNISAVDANLFVVLHAVLEEGTTTGAAARLNLTQSAISNALARLRRVVGDPLLVRGGRRLVPTPRAEAMRPAVAEAIRCLSGALGDAFDPRTSDRTFTIACADHHQAADVPRLAHAFAAALPRACLRVVSVDYLVASDGLASGAVDVAMAPTGTAGAGLHVAPLFVEASTLVVRADHPRVKRSVSIAELNRLGHIDVHVALGKPGEVNRAVSERLLALGVHRRIAMVVPSFTTAAMAAASTDYVGWLPSHAARLFTRALPLRAVDAPLPRLEVGCALVWHERTHADPGCTFFRGLVREALGEGTGRHARSAHARRR